MGLVLDASTALAWIIRRADPAEDQLADQTLIRLQADDAVVPSLWFVEVANGLLVAERKNVTSPAKSARFLALLSSLPIEPDQAAPRALQPVWLADAKASGLSAYDAAYLELAARTSRTLATFDRRLAGAARAAGVKVFGDSP
jgi:predicted nucleic acid-binding protein